MIPPRTLTLHEISFDTGIKGKKLLTLFEVGKLIFRKEMI